MTEDDLKSFLADNADEIKAEVKRRAINKLLEEHRWEIGGKITEAVNEFVAAEIIPEVKAHLQSEKSAILAAALKGSVAIGDAIAKGMAERAAKNLASDGYQFRSVMEALFKL